MSLIITHRQKIIPFPKKKFLLGESTSQQQAISDNTLPLMVRQGGKISPTLPLLTSALQPVSIDMFLGILLKEAEHVNR